MKPISTEGLSSPMWLKNCSETEDCTITLTIKPGCKAGLLHNEDIILIRRESNPMHVE